MFLLGDVEHAGQFIAGWLTEYSLSIDNLFVFLIIMSRFSVPRKYQQEMLMVGIILALVFRGIFIITSAQLIASFSWVFYVFGAFLIWTAVRQALMDHEDEEEKENAIIRFLRNRIPITDEYEGGKLRITRNGARVFTPVIIVFIALGTTDLVFAIDSIPAIFGITESPFIVFTANVFALMGLRQLYFLLGDLVDKLVYLKYGIAFILGFIGVKLFLHALHDNELPFINGGEHVTWVPEIDTWTSLGVIVGNDGSGDREPHQAPPRRTQGHQGRRAQRRRDHHGARRSVGAAGKSLPALGACRPTRDPQLGRGVLCQRSDQGGRP